MNRTDQAFFNEFQVDLLHTVRMVDAALPHLERSEAGAIVVISSVSGLEHDFMSPAYGTFKAALIHYASRMASELRASTSGSTALARQHLLRGGIWQRIERDLPDLFKEAMARTLGPHGDRSGGGERRGASREPGVELDHRREPGGRRRADRRVEY